MKKTRFTMTWKDFVLNTDSIEEMLVELGGSLKDGEPVTLKVRKAVAA